MSGIDRIGGPGGRIQRDTPSEGHDRLERDELKASKQAQQTERNSKVDEVAKLYEKQFLREMMKAMRSTVSYGNDKPSMGEGIYRDQLDNEYVEKWGDQGGVGLSNLIYDQLMERFFTQGQGKSLRSQGPIQLTDKDVTSVMRVKNSETPAGQVPLRVDLKPSADGTPAKLQAPWDGEVIANTKAGEKSVVTLSHGDGARSTFIFKGVPTADAQVGQKVPRGQTFGILSPEAKSFFWNVGASAQAAMPQMPQAKPDSTEL